MRFFLLFILYLIGSLSAYADDFVLSAQCPASFEKRDGQCKLRTIYQQYSSLQNAGVGGLKTGLPAFRDGFTAQEIDLGRYLFFDPLLSRDGKLACASCHDPDKGFSDGRKRSIGADGHEVARNSPSLWNVGFLTRLFWDGREKTLEAQMQGPLFSKEEMATTPEKMLANLNANKTYRGLFASAYPTAKSETKQDAKAGIQINQVYRAIAAFESSLVSLNSRYDLYAHGFADALTRPEIEGLNVFRSFVARCAECHTPPLFTNQQIAVIGSAEETGRAFDQGAGASGGEATLRGGFKVPSLRNVEFTAPYMHSGRFSSLKETVSFYTKGRGHAVPKNEKLLLHWHIHEPKLSEAELNRLVDFLKTLSDESFKPQRPQKVPSGLAMH